MRSEGSVKDQGKSVGQTPVAERKFRCYTRTGDKGMSSLFSGERRKKDDNVFQALGDVDELNSSLGLAAEYCRIEGLDVVCEQIATIQSRLLDVGSAVATPTHSSSESKLVRVKFDPTAASMLEAWLDSMDDQLPPLRNFILPSGGLAASQLHVARSICRRAERSVVALGGGAGEMGTCMGPGREGCTESGAREAAAVGEPSTVAEHQPEEQRQGGTQDEQLGSGLPDGLQQEGAREEKRDGGGGTHPEGHGESGGRLCPGSREPRIPRQGEGLFGSGGGHAVEASVLCFLNRLSDYLFTAARYAAARAGRDEAVYKKS